MWLSSVNSHLFSYSNFSVRFASAVAGVLLVLLVYVITRDIFKNSRAGVIASTLILFTPAILFRSRQGSLDVMLTLFIMAGLYALTKVRNNPKWWYGVGLAFALAFMTKGFASLTLPVVSIAIILLDKKLRESVLSIKEFYLGTLLTPLVIILPWHLYMLHIYGNSFINSYFGYHVFHRASSAIEGHTGGPAFYLVLLLKTYLPWLLLVIPASIIVYKKTSHLQKYKLAIFTGFTALTLLIYSLVIQTKLDWYILPIYPPIAIIIGGAVAYYATRWRHLIFIIIGLILSITMVVSAIPSVKSKLQRYYTNTYQN